MTDFNSVILIGNDTGISSEIQHGLHGEKFKVTRFSHLSMVLKRKVNKEYAFCIIIQKFPSPDTIVHLKKLRNINPFIVLIVVDKGYHDSQISIEAFKAGADVYMGGPFMMVELIHRLRRITTMMTTVHRAAPDLLVFGNMRIHDGYLLCNSGAYNQHLTEKELDVLSILVSRKNSIVRRGDILLSVWGKEDYFLSRSMDVVLSRLREYLKQDDSVSLQTIHGIGYRLKELEIDTFAIENNSLIAPKVIFKPNAPVGIPA